MVLDKEERRRSNLPTFAEHGHCHLPRGDFSFWLPGPGHYKVTWLCQLSFLLKETFFFIFSFVELNQGCKTGSFSTWRGRGQGKGNAQFFFNAALAPPSWLFFSAALVTTFSTLIVMYGTIKFIDTTLPSSFTNKWYFFLRFIRTMVEYVEKKFKRMDNDLAR